MSNSTFICYACGQELPKDQMRYKCMCRNGDGKSRGICDTDVNVEIKDWKNAPSDLEHHNFEKIHLLSKETDDYWKIVNETTKGKYSSFSMNEKGVTFIYYLNDPSYGLSDREFEEKSCFDAEFRKLVKKELVMPPFPEPYCTCCESKKT